MYTEEIRQLQLKQELTTKERKLMGKLQRLQGYERQEQEDLEHNKKIYYFNNEPLKWYEAGYEYNYSVLKYINEFLGEEEEHETKHIQRFKFDSKIGKHWYVGDWDGLRDVNVYLDSVKKEIEKVRKPGETEWRKRVRKWYSGRFECNEDLYNCTFGFSQYDDEDFGDVWASYEFICSKKYDVQRLIEGLIKEGID